MLDSIVRRVPFFATLPDSEIRRLALNLRETTIPANTVLFRESERGDRFYVIIDGQVELTKALDGGGERQIALRRAGEYIGEMSLLNPDGVRTASARTVTTVRALEMTRADFEELLHRRPLLAYQLARVMSDRLEAAHRTAIADLEEKNRQLQQAADELRAAQAEIIEKKQIEHELELAREIQLSILPLRMPQKAGYDFGARLLPMSSIGGDFYDFIPLGPDRLGIAIGDVAGHGVPAALVMAVTVAVLRAEGCQGCSPCEVLARVNRELLKLSGKQMFVTVLYGVLDTLSGAFLYARAGHEPPLLLSPSGSVFLDDGRGPLLGVFDAPAFKEATVRLESRSSLVLYTDAVVEARDGHGVFFDARRFMQTVSEHAQAGAQEVCDGVTAAVAGFSSARSQQDDITVLCVQTMADGA
jgi:phosphoserine phosphatase RsbU/P